MVRITIDDELKKQFEAADGLIDLCDESGRLVMQVAPIPAAPASPRQPLSDDDLERLSKVEGPTISSEQLLQRLRAKL